MSDPVRKRRLACGLCLIAAPLLGLLGAILEPERSDDPSKALRLVDDQATRLGLAVLLYLVSSALLVFAVLGIVQLLRDRAPAYGDVGAALAIIGILAVTTLTGFRWVQYHLAEAGDRTEMESLYDRLYSGAAIAALYVVALALSIGSIVLAVGLYRARVVASWTTALIVIGAILLQLAYALLDGSSGKALAIAAFVCSLAGLGTVGWLVLSRTDEEWLHPPEYRGLRAPAR